MDQIQNYLYETTVSKEIKEKISEKRQENGQEIEVSKEVISLKPIKIAILKPNRKKFKSAEIFYAKKLSSYLKEGLLPHSLVAKRYLNDGGPLSEDAIKVVDTMRKKHLELQSEYFGMKLPLSEEDNKRRSMILLEINEINKALQEIENTYSEIFENTAEAKSKADTIEWWILNLSFIEDDKGYKPFFGDGTDEEKLQKLYELDNLNNEFNNEVIKKFSYFISFWFSSGGNITLQDFQVAEENYNLSLKKPDEKPMHEVESKDKPVESTP